MQGSKAQVETLTIRQKLLLGALMIFSLIIAAILVYYFSPANATGQTAPGPALFQDATEGYANRSTLE